MTQHHPGQQWGPQPGSIQAPKMRKRPAFYIVMAATWVLTFGCTAAVVSGINEGPTDAKAAAKVSAAPGPTVTETVTATPKPKTTVAPTVTATVTATATKTVTKEPKAAADDSSSGGDSSVYYQNCSAAKAAGAAPVHRGDPGYGPHLDRDGDGVGCEW